MESFNLYNSIDSGNARIQLGGWSCDYPHDSNVDANGRYGNRALYKPSTGGREDWFCAFTPAVSTFTLGFDFYTSSQNIYIMNLTGEANHLTIIRGPSGEIQITRGEGGPLLLQTAAGAHPADKWQYIEIGGVIHDTAGALRIWVEGVLLASADNIDTRNGGAAGVWGTMQIPESGWKYIANIYVKDEMGPAWGPLKIEMLAPTSDDANAGFSPSAGAALWDMVDEVITDADTTYISASAVDDQVTFGYGDLGGSGSIRAIQLRPSARRTDGTARSIRSVIKDDSNVKVGTADFALAASYSFGRGAIFTTDASNNPWTLATVNGMRAGVKVTV